MDSIQKTDSSHTRNRGAGIGLLKHYDMAYTRYFNSKARLILNNK